MIIQANVACVFKHPKTVKKKCKAAVRGVIFVNDTYKCDLRLLKMVSLNDPSLRVITVIFLLLSSAAVGVRFS